MLFSTLLALSITFTLLLPHPTPAKADTTYTYDLLGRLTSVTYNSGKTITYSYDAHGNITAVETSGFITVGGAILYQPSTYPAKVELFDSTESTRFSSADTAENGSYTLIAPAAPSGTLYTLKVSKPGYLSYTIKNFTLTPGEHIENIDISQLAGDVNGDGIVNSIDLTYLLSEFNRAPQKYPNADIDRDGVVNSIDLTYLLAGFNKRNVVIE